MEYAPGEKLVSANSTGAKYVMKQGILVTLVNWYQPTPSRRLTSDCKISPRPMSVVLRDVVGREIRVLLKEAALSGVHFPF